MNNNPYFQDLEIDFDNLAAYPDNDEDYVEGLNTIIVETGEEESDPAAVYTEEEGQVEVTYSAMPVELPAATVREEITRLVLGETPGEETVPLVEWPDRTGPPISEKTPGFFSMAFPWLPGFCHGRADITVLGRPAGNPQYLAWIGHLLRHPSHLFSQDQRFLLYAVNRYKRDKALTQGNVYAKYSAKDITVENLKERVAASDLSVFKSLMYFSRSSIGTFAYVMNQVSPPIFRVPAVFQVRGEEVA